MFEGMFNNTGEKIKVLAKVIFVLGIISAVISGIYLMTGGGIAVLYGFITVIGGALGSWVVSIFIYGFGAIITNTETTASKADNISKKTIEIANNEKKNTKEEVKGKTSFDKSLGEKYVNFNCPACKATLSYSENFLADKTKVTCPMCDAEIDIKHK